MTESLDAADLARQVTFVVTLLALLVGHQVGDHVLQSDRQAAEKCGPGRAALRAMAGHLLAYHLAVGAVLAVVAFVLHLPLSVPGVVAGLAFSAVTHGLLDRRHLVRVVLQRTGSPRFAEQTTPVCGMYVADQALHWLCLLISALLIATL
ncbi:DUF3307 domain-containing protein [Spirilliplanes yamanashiensis]|uniref:DUF3307 domain-containing protein n=1 Tax=Spirilliplanes yamanashiensis TaxID=42233 RepID=A0A8J3YC34_9ACTN|nr:DUF3307 domain-containing protein [Spirilliplanes yamanashiensis]MDP9818786.1 hypothetical protein [Spirilliplanes yamanashiensis]GIJ05240.1 hypothetical protein Sya03_45920 [Spirilliplanes yamanashiensis]